MRAVTGLEIAGVQPIGRGTVVSSDVTRAGRGDTVHFGIFPVRVTAPLNCSWP